MFFDKIRCPGEVGFFSKILDKNVKIPTSRDDVDRCTRLSTASNNPARGRGYFLVKDYWGCAAGWGHIFTTGLSIMGLHF